MDLRDSEKAIAPWHSKPVWLRPVVRYVDESVAVIDLHVDVGPRRVFESGPPRWSSVELLIHVRESDGFVDEQLVALNLQNQAAVYRMEIISPQRWWPAGMGEQALYEIKAALLLDGDVVDQRVISIGLTSVSSRANGEDQAARQDQGASQFLVNGRPRVISSLVPVDLVNEHRLLPAAGDSILLIRDHYGPDLLYEAADRAGILLIQCVPIHPEGKPEGDVDLQVLRLATHPSLAGWFVGHLGGVTPSVVRAIQSLDPTHSIFNRLPLS